MEFSRERLREMREKTGFSQEKMADNMGISHSHYNRLESGKRNIKMDHIAKIAQAVGTNEEEILKEIHQANGNGAINNKQERDNVFTVNDIVIVKELLAAKDEIIKAKDEIIKAKDEIIAVQQKTIETLLRKV